jgi:spoIIIJ-associated protein
MEWVETTGKTVTEAQDLALDRLGVGADDAEFEVLEEPKSGLFGRTRGEARVRARVKPTAVRPKQERRPRGRKAEGAKKQTNGGRTRQPDPERSGDRPPAREPRTAPPQQERTKQPRQHEENQRMDHEHPQSDVSPQEVGEAAVAFMSQLAAAFGATDAATSLAVDGVDLDVRVTGTELGLMVGPGGRTLIAIQDLARVASQRRLGDHETRLRIDVGGYREKRREALEKFAASVAAEVIESGSAKALEPMPSSDRKAVHDAIIEIEGVTSHSEGDDPTRRVVITPA